MKSEEVQSLIAGCFNGEPASCSYACPFHLDLRSFLKKVANGRWSAAYKEMCTVLIFPEVVSVLCQGKCETVCQRTLIGDEAVAVADVERAVLAYVKKKEPVTFSIPAKEARIAVVGAGSSGLACALGLAQKRYQVSVFEKKSQWGGSLVNHPSFCRFNEDFERQFAPVKVTFNFEQEIKVLDELSEYDAIFVATGYGGNHFDLIDGWDSASASTLNPRVFLGGELVGLSLLDSIYFGAKAAKSIEAFLQNGTREFGREEWDKQNCHRFVQHDGASSIPRVPRNGEIYSEDEAKCEAARCLECDCDKCLSACELLVRYKKKPHHIAADVLMDGQARNSVSSAAIMRQTWSCNLCGRCALMCSEGADIGGLFQLSRTERVDQNVYPPALHDYWLRELDFNMNDGAVMRMPKGQKSCKFVFFPGCRLGASNPDYVIKSYEFLKNNYDVGIILGCCGIPALWAGDKNRFEFSIKQIRKQWETMGRPVFIVACASCEKVLEKSLPEIHRKSLYSILKEFDIQDPVESSQEMAIFDPCAAALHSNLKSSVRTLAERLNIKVSDYDNGGECCGFGGHIQLANPHLYEEIIDNRINEREEPYLVYCANCREVFSAKGKECKHILDLFFGLNTQGVPTLDEKRRNVLEVKQIILEKYWGESIKTPKDAWDNMLLDIDIELQKEMEKKLISASDVRRTVWNAERAGEGFKGDDGSILCCRSTPILTYWVQYRKNTDRYEILNAYSHRMHFREGV